MEKRSISDTPEVRTVGENGGSSITGYAARYYVPGDSSTEYRLWDGAVERIMPGAFDQALQTSDVRALFNHDPNQVLGRVKSGTLALTADERGLRYETTPAETTVYRDVVEMLRRGDVDGSSFQFRVVEENWTKDAGQEVRELRKVELFDVGPVTFPAYAAASSGVRSELSEARSSYDAWSQSAKTDHQAERDKMLTDIL